MIVEEREATEPDTPAVPVLPARTSPVQARSAARVETLLDAAAAVVDEVGFERLTTAMVAERAGASIGTVYRYFPDRIALLHALSTRLFARYVRTLAERHELRSRSHWQDTLDDIIDVFADMYRTEAGFRAIRFGDTLDITQGEDEESSGGRLAEILATDLADAVPDADRASVVFALEVVVGMIEALLHRAFVASAEGDPRFIDEARTVTREYLIRAINVPA
ncbi:TetR/AcrR family transcriptional regulator [Planctomonas psychrotolerans]|uniref:TetR/AcrR family transcriptional regulator n=1 Tax=Planctomonas psychrotolerans TaxID=2528712 RepID=UPI001D0D19BF|nr:TetR/AcrR family transcriptional regulator [Planctomonas psychrotolerans]